MRQEVQVTVRLTYDAPADATREELRAAIMEDLNRLADADSEATVEMTGGAILTLREESAIYAEAQQ